MWLFLNDAFISIVAPSAGSDADKQGMLVVRARLQGDLQKVFPGVRVSEDTKCARDYRYRAVVSRAVVAEAIAGRVKRVDYTNFKDSIDDPKLGRTKEKWRHNLYMRVWNVMFTAQEDRRPPKQRDQRYKAKPAGHDLGAAYGSDLRDTHDPYDPTTWWKPRR